MADASAGATEVATRRHEEAISALKRTILAGATSGRHSGLALIGPTGSGKTATVQYVERWLRDELNLKVDDPSPLPIVLTTTRSTSKSLVSNVARAGGDPLAGTRTQDDEELNLRDAAPRMQVHGFAFDELHNAFAAKSESELARMAMTLKTLANSLSMPLIAMGINGLEDYLDAHPELRQRFERRVYLDDPEVSSADDVRDMRKLLAAMNAVVPCEADCVLATQDMLVGDCGSWRQSATPTWKAWQGWIARLATQEGFDTGLSPAFGYPIQELT